MVTPAGVRQAAMMPTYDYAMYTPGVPARMHKCPKMLIDHGIKLKMNLLFYTLCYTAFTLPYKAVPYKARKAIIVKRNETRSSRGNYGVYVVITGCTKQVTGCT